MDASDNQNGISGDTAFHNGEGGLKGSMLHDKFCCSGRLPAQIKNDC